MQGAFHGCRGGPGERACPPEDCGGVDGYYETLQRLRDPDDEEHEATKTWIEGMTGGPFDPEAFDPARATKRMGRGLPEWRSERWR